MFAQIVSNIQRIILKVIEEIKTHEMVVCIQTTFKLYLRYE